MAYVSKEELRQQIKQLKNDTDNVAILVGINRVGSAIAKLPTADVAEVKHGHWKDRYGNKYDNHLYECSVCGEKALYEFYTNELGQIKSRQALTFGCPCCLAKMDGRSDA